MVYAPWLIVLLALALVPAFLGEAHFNAQSYSLNYARTPERRELDYVRQTGASVETAKEVKIFGLNAFLIERYRALVRGFYRGQPPARRPPRRLGRPAHRDRHGRLLRRLRASSPGARCAATSRSATSPSSSGSFRRLRNLLEGLLIGFSQVAGQALYLDDLFSFFEIEPEIVSPAEPAAVPGADPRGLHVRGRRLPLPRRRALGGART